MNDVVVGKRVTFGMIVGGVVSTGCWLWGVTHPENPVPAEIAIGITTALTGIGQVFIANKFGITGTE